jgi:chromosome segregation ATPase
LELPKVDNEVAEQLQNKLGNLKDENESLRQELAKEKENYGTLAIISQQLNQQLEEVKADRAKLLESSTHVTNKLRQEVQELRSQLNTERASREEIEAELSPAKAKFCSGRHTFREINTRRGNNSQPASSQAQKIKNRSGRFGSHSRTFARLRREIKLYNYLLPNG